MSRVTQQLPSSQVELTRAVQTGPGLSTKISTSTSRSQRTGVIEEQLAQLLPTQEDTVVTVVGDDAVVFRKRFSF